MDIKKGTLPPIPENTTLDTSRTRKDTRLQNMKHTMMTSGKVTNKKSMLSAAGFNMLKGINKHKLG